MRWWITARQAHSLLPAALATYTLLLLLFQGHTVVLPSPVTSSGSPVLLLLTAPIPVCAAVLACLESRLPSAEATGVRPVRFLDTSLVLTTTLAALALAAAAHTLLGIASALSAGRNTAFLLGLMLCALPLIGRRAALLPPVWVITVAMAGFEQGRAQAWTVIARETDDPWAASASALSLAIGLILYFFAPRTR
ncbi:hypothetical protein ABZ820_40565 [Streptomyces diacarni]|uniref:hypothetical protein n=1 Tax=Streptomyces diacarni TaxID=2800381 RepID=UPI0033D439F5